MGNSFVYVTRGGIRESEHFGSIAVVSSSGKLLAHYGDPNYVTFARSSAKPMQAIPLVESGAVETFLFDESDLAQCCASHSSELQHTERVLSMLQKIGLDESYLQCGPHIPHSMETYDRLIRAGKALTSLYSNCSGKHTGMLAYSKHIGADLSTYYEINHPLQQTILSAVSELTDVPKDRIVIGRDGCGVPTFALPIANFALSYARFTNPEGLKHGEAMKRISAAMRSYPELVGGTDRFDTDLMKVTNGRILAKVGAEGFIIAADTIRKFALAIKVQDGNSRAIPPAVIRTLAAMDALSSEEREWLHKYEEPELLNTRGEKIGNIIADFELEFKSSAHVTAS